MTAMREIGIAINNVNLVDGKKRTDETRHKAMCGGSAAWLKRMRVGTRVQTSAEMPVAPGKERTKAAQEGAE
jgi:hypothetical protein